MEAPGRTPQRILCAPTPRSWQVDVSHQRCSPSEQLHVIAAQRSVGLSSPHSTHPHAGWTEGWSGGRESWSGSPHPGQTEPPPSGQPLALPLTAIQNGQRGWPGTWMVMIGLTRHPKPAEPHLTRNRRHEPSPPPGMGRGVRPTGPAEWYKIRLLPILQPTGPVRRVRAAASAEAV